MDQFEHMEKLLDTKLEGFFALIKLEIGNVKKEVGDISTSLASHKEDRDEEVKRMEGSIIRVHARIDEVERQMVVVANKKPSVKDIIKAKVIEWLVPVVMLFGLWLLTSGNLTSFINSLLGGHVKS